MDLLTLALGLFRACFDLITSHLYSGLLDNMHVDFSEILIISVGIVAAHGGVEFRWAHLIPSWE